MVPNGSVGFRWGEEGKWNLLEKSGTDQAEIEAELSCIDSKDDVVAVDFPHFAPDENDTLTRNIPARKLKLASGEDALVCSVFDMQVAQYGIDRGLGDDTWRPPTKMPAYLTPRPGPRRSPASNVPIWSVPVASSPRTRPRPTASPWSSWVRRSTTGITTT